MSNIPEGSGIYRITCTVTTLIYIGSTKNLRKRWLSHLSDLRNNKHGNPKLQRAFNKHGPDAFIFEILEFVLAPFLLEREQYWLDRIQPFGKKGFNIAISAQSFHLGLKHTPESIAKMRVALRGRPGSRLGSKASDETRAKQSAAKLGKPSPRLGYKETRPEVRAKNAAARKGKPNPHPGVPRTPEARAKIAAAGLGRKHRLESRAKMSANMQGNARGAKDYIVTSPEGIEYEVRDLTAFCKERQLIPQALSSVAAGKRKHHKGWVARRIHKTV